MKLSALRNIILIWTFFPEWVFKFTHCIFRHYEFLNDPSKCRPYLMHNYIGCICAVFLLSPWPHYHNWFWETKCLYCWLNFDCSMLNTDIISSNFWLSLFNSSFITLMMNEFCNRWVRQLGDLVGDFSTSSAIIGSF